MAADAVGGHEPRDPRRHDVGFLRATGHRWRQRHPRRSPGTPTSANPQRDGRVRVDLHTHTMWSGDSTTTPDEFAAAVEASGLDVVCITDHNAIDGAVELRDRLACRVIVGEELRTAAGEIIGLFLTERVPMGISHLDAARAIRDQGGVVYIPHPFDPMRRNMTEAALYELAEADLIDAVEVLNAKTSLRASIVERPSSPPSSASSVARAATATSPMRSALPTSRWPTSTRRWSSSHRSRPPTWSVTTGTNPAPGPPASSPR